MKKRLLSLALALLMVLSMLPVTALATTHTPPPTEPTWDDVTKDTKKFNKLEFEVDCDTIDSHDADDIKLNSLTKDTDYTVSGPTSADKHGKKYKFTVNLIEPESYCNAKAPDSTHTLTKTKHQMSITVEYDDGEWKIDKYTNGEYDCKCTPTQKTHTLKYDLNGSSGTFSDDTWTGSANSHKFTISSDRPTRTHYNFLGWADSTDAATASYQPNGEITVSGTKTIYALWERSACYDNNTDGFCDGCKECMHNHDTDGYCAEDDCTHSDTCCPKPQPPAQTDPDMDSLPNAIGAVKVKVVCATGVAWHTVYSLNLDAYTTQKNGNEVTVTLTTPSTYVAAYTLAFGAHTYDETNVNNKLTFIMEWALNTEGNAYVWKLKDAQPQVMVKCETAPNPPVSTTVEVDLGDYIKKTLTVNGSGFTDETFTVTVTEGVPVTINPDAPATNNLRAASATAYTGTVTMTAAGTANFVFANGGNALELDEGTHTFTVVETEGTTDGMTYDTESKTLTITVTEVDKALTASDDVVTVTNTYTQPQQPNPPQPPQTTTLPVYAYTQTVNSANQRIVLPASDLTRIGMAYNDASNAWVTLGQLDLNGQEYTLSNAKAAALTTDMFTRHSDSGTLPIANVAFYQLGLVSNYNHLGYQRETGYDAYHLDGVTMFYKVTFDVNANGDYVDKVPSDAYYYGNESFVAPENDPRRVGYTFTGWYADKGCTTPAPETITADTTLYAGWQLKSSDVHLVIYNSKDLTKSVFDQKIATDKSALETIDLTALKLTDYYPGSYDVVAGPYDDGLFNQYKNGQNPAALSSLTITGNHQNIKYVITNRYTVKFDGNDATSGTMADQSFLYDEEKALTENGFSRTGYTFTGWNTQADGKGTAYADKALVKNLASENDAVVTLYAQWAVRTDLTCIVRYVKKGTTTPVHEPTTVTGLTYGEPYTATALSISGYRLYGDREQTITVGLENEIVFEYTRKSSSSSSSSSKPSSSGSTLKFNTKDHDAYIKGYPDGTVKPYGSITRAEVATILYRIMDDDCVERYYTTRNRFYDVDSSKWYNTYVSTLANAGVIVDSNNGYFRPDEAITRAELAVMIAQFASTSTSNTSRFTDVFSTHWAYQEIGIAEKLGWIAGYPDGSFRPDATITRAEMVTMVNRALNRLPSSEERLLSRARMVTFPDCEPDDWFYLAIQEAANGHTYRSIGKYGDEEWIALTK